MPNIAGRGNAQNGPDLKALGFNSPMEVIDILALMKIDGEPVIKNDRALLDPKAKAQEVFEHFNQKFNISPSDLPYLASVIKKQYLKRSFEA